MVQDFVHQQYDILYLDVRQIFESRGFIPLDCFYPRCCSAEAMAVNLFEVEAFGTETLKDSGRNHSQLVQVQKEKQQTKVHFHLGCRRCAFDT